MYNEKIWGVPCSTISYDWGNQRVDGLNVKNIFKRILGIGKNPRTFISRFYYPQFGIGSFVSKFSEKLDNIILNFKVEKISGFNGGWKIKSGKKEMKLPPDAEQRGKFL